MLFNGIWEEEE